MTTCYFIFSNAFIADGLKLIASGYGTGSHDDITGIWLWVSVGGVRVGGFSSSLKQTTFKFHLFYMTRFLQSACDVDDLFFGLYPLAQLEKDFIEIIYTL